MSRCRDLRLAAACLLWQSLKSRRGRWVSRPAVVSQQIRGRKPNYGGHEAARGMLRLDDEIVGRKKARRKRPLKSRFLEVNDTCCAVPSLVDDLWPRPRAEDSFFSFLFLSGLHNNGFV